MTKSIKLMLVLVLCSIMLYPLTSSAKELGEIHNIVEPKSEISSSCDVRLSISGTQANATSSFTGTLSTSSVSISMHLEKKDSDRWLPYATWSDSTNGIRLSMERNCSVTTGTYRLVTRFTVVTNGQSESTIVISPERKCN